MKTIVLNINDTSPSGKILHQVSVSLQRSRITVRELIEARVLAEVEKYNAKLPEYFTGLIQPATAESTKNGFKMRDRKKVDAEKQVYIALDAFQKNGFFLLIDKFQVESLDQEIVVSPETQISFIKLTPLVGG